MNVLVIVDRWENVKAHYPGATKQRYRDFCEALTDKLLNDIRVTWIEAVGREVIADRYHKYSDIPVYRDFDMVLTFGVNSNTMAGRASEYYASQKGIEHYELLHSWEKYYER